MPAFFDVLVPKRCTLCDGDLAKDLLCANCLSLCNRIPFKGSLIHDEPQALFYYELALKELIKGAKFGHRLSCAYAIRQLFLEALAHEGRLAALREFSPSAIAYIPTHWLKRSLRGLDLPSLLASSLASALGCPLVHYLKKRKYSDQQSSLSKKSERLKKAKGVFALRAAAQAQERLLLIDDIVTTGATLAEAKRLLSRRCKNIQLLALAKTP